MFSICNKKKIILISVLILIVLCCIVGIVAMVSFANNSFSDEEKSRLEVIKKSEPAIFELDKEKDLYVFVYRMSPDSLECMISNNAQKYSFSLNECYIEEHHVMMLNPDDVKLLIKYYGYKDNQVKIIPSKLALSSCFYQINDDFVNEIKETFDNKYSVINYSPTE